MALETGDLDRTLAKRRKAKTPQDPELLAIEKVTRALSTLKASNTWGRGFLSTSDNDASYSGRVEAVHRVLRYAVDRAGLEVAIRVTRPPDTLTEVQVKLR